MRTATSSMSQPLSLLAMCQLHMSHVTSSDIKGSQLSKLKYQLCYHYASLRVARLHRYYFYKLDTTTGVDRKITAHGKPGSGFRGTWAITRPSGRYGRGVTISGTRTTFHLGSKIGDWTVNGKLHCNMHNKHYHHLAPMTLQHFLKVRWESMIVKTNFYVTDRKKLQKWIDKSRTFARYILLV